MRRIKLIVPSYVPPTTKERTYFYCLNEARITAKMCEARTKSQRCPRGYKLSSRCRAYKKGVLDEK